MAPALNFDAMSVIVENTVDLDGAELILRDDVQYNSIYVQLKVPLMPVQQTSKDVHQHVSRHLAKQNLIYIEYTGPSALSLSSRVPLIWSKVPGQGIGEPPLHTFNISIEVVNLAPRRPELAILENCVVSQADFNVWAHLTRCHYLIHLPSFSGPVMPRDRDAEVWCERYASPLRIQVKALDVKPQASELMPYPLPKPSASALEDMESLLSLLAVDNSAGNIVLWRGRELGCSNPAQIPLFQRAEAILCVLNKRYARVFNMLRSDGTGLVWSYSPTDINQSPFHEELGSILDDYTTFLSQYRCAYGSQPQSHSGQYGQMRALFCRMVLNTWNLHLAFGMHPRVIEKEFGQCTTGVESCMCASLEGLLDIDVIPGAKPSECLPWHQWLELCHTNIIVHRVWHCSTESYATEEEHVEQDDKGCKFRLKLALGELEELYTEAAKHRDCENLRGHVKQDMDIIRSAVNDDLGKNKGDVGAITSCEHYSEGHLCAVAMSWMSHSQSSIRLVDPQSGMIIVPRPQLTTRSVPLFPGKALTGISTAWVTSGDVE